jgi:hypothetical protein
MCAHQIVAKPNHPFFTYLIERLPRYHMSWFSSAYASNMFSTGPSRSPEQRPINAD